MRTGYQSRRKSRINLQSDVFTLSHAKTYLGRLIDRAAEGQAIYITRGQQRFLLQAVPPIDPIPLRPPGYYTQCYTKAENQEAHELARASVTRAPEDLE